VSKKIKRIDRSKVSHCIYWDLENSEVVKSSEFYSSFDNGDILTYRGIGIAWNSRSRKNDLQIDEAKQIIDKFIESKDDLYKALYGIDL
jgi:hypothetical protein